MKKVKVLFEPAHQMVEVEKGTSLLDAGDMLGLFINAECGGAGMCGKCKVRLLSADDSLDPAEEELLSAEEIRDGLRLACRKNITADSVVELVEEKVDSGAKLKSVGESFGPEVDSGIEKYVLDVAEADYSADMPLWEVMKSKLPRAIGDYEVGLEVLRSIASMARAKGGERLTLIGSSGIIIGAEAGDTSSQIYGIAIDIGTTTIACYLIDLTRGVLISSAARTNSQAIYGADIMSRINYAMTAADGLSNLSSKVIKDINALIEEICKKGKVDRERVYSASFVGNTAMQHLFFGLDPRCLGLAPYNPVVKDEIEFRAGDMGLALMPTVRCFYLPAVSGTVGADTVGLMLATGIPERKSSTLLAIDIGTNGETVLSRRGEVLCCSNAAGPAFEGAHIEMGMRAVPGAIERVDIDGKLRVKTIGGAPPRGICGSGLIDAVAALLRVGIVDKSGRLAAAGDGSSRPDSDLSGRIRRGNQTNTFILAWETETSTGLPVYISQKDIREVQLASGAISAGIRVLLKEMGIGLEDIDEVLVAGAFGSYIRPENAARIGLIPRLPKAKVKFVGNAAGTGAVLALLSRKQRQKAIDIARCANYVMLAGRQDFQELFLEAMIFPES